MENRYALLRCGITHILGKGWLQSWNVLKNLYLNTFPSTSFTNSSSCFTFISIYSFSVTLEWLTKLNKTFRGTKIDSVRKVRIFWNNPSLYWAVFFFLSLTAHTSLLSLFSVKTVLSSFLQFLFPHARFSSCILDQCCLVLTVLLFIKHLLSFLFVSSLLCIWFLSTVVMHSSVIYFYTLLIGDITANFKTVRSSGPIRSKTSF